MRMFMAGCDTVKFAKTNLVADHPYCLASYYNGILNQKDAQLSKVIIEMAKRGANWIMDSGLFTMMFGAESHRVFSAQDLHAYTDRYIETMQATGFPGDIVEMDVHKVLGMGELKSFRDKFEQRWGTERTIFVWHREETEQGWRDMTKRYPYVALSIPELRIVCGRNAKLLKHFIAKMLTMAKEQNPNIKVHLLGCTQMNLLEQPHEGGAEVIDSNWVSDEKIGIHWLDIAGRLSANRGLKIAYWRWAG